MNAADSLVLEFLATRAGFVVNQIEHLQLWWQAARGDGESLPAFLLRQQLLSDATVRILVAVGERRLSRSAGFPLVDLGEVEQFRRRLPEVALTDGVPDTDTLLCGDDTALDLEPPARDPASPVEPPRVGARLGKYLLTDWVGQGASGMVYRALHPTLHIPVAIKLLHGSSDDRLEKARQLAAEARLLALLNHPNVVRLYDFEADPAQPYLVLEHVNGASLAELIDQCGRVQPARAVRILKCLADALAAAHQLGIMHRDIKPGNVLISRCGDVKLTDLGLAAVINRHGLLSASPMAASARVGTASYVAPEIIDSASFPDDRSDMYSLGATMFHALTGRPPFDGCSKWEVIERQIKSAPPCPRALAPELPASLAGLITRMLARDPASRPPSMRALLAEPALNQPSAPDFLSRGKEHSSVWRRTLEKLGRVASFRQLAKTAQPGR